MTKKIKQPSLKEILDEVKLLKEKIIQLEKKSTVVITAPYPVYQPVYPVYPQYPTYPRWINQTGITTGDVYLSGTGTTTNITTPGTTTLKNPNICNCAK